MKTIQALAICMVLALGLAVCGGGLNTATPKNTSPVANAGADRGAIISTPVTLDGSASFDSDGDAITYPWTFDLRPTGSAATLVNATTVSPSFTPDMDGDFVVSLVVNDGTVDSSPDDVTITARPLWGTETLIESGSGDAYYPQVAVDPSGNAVAVWYQYDGSYYSIYANRYDATNGWGTEELIESGSGIAYYL